MSVRIDAAEDDRALGKFVRFYDRAHAHQAARWPAFVSFELAVLGKNSPYLDGRAVRPLIARQDGEIVARCVAVLDERYCRHWGERLGHVVLFEAMPWAGAAARRMLDPSHLDPAFPEQVLLAPEGYRSEDRNPGFIQLVEAASISRIGEEWVMLYSVGDFSERNYKLGVAYSDTLIPPPGETYRKVLIPDEKDLWKSGKGKEICYLLQSEHEDWPNYCGDRVIGPGSGCIVLSERRPHLVFHGYDPEEFKRGRAERRLWSVALDIAIGRARPVEDWIRPVLSKGGLPVRLSTQSK